MTDEERNQRVAKPIYIEIPGGLTDEGIEALKKDFQESLMTTITSGEKIPYNDAGCERVHQIFKEAYERIVAKTHITISVTVEK